MIKKDSFFLQIKKLWWIIDKIKLILRKSFIIKEENMKFY